MPTFGSDLPDSPEADSQGAWLSLGGRGHGSDPTPGRILLREAT